MSCAMSIYPRTEWFAVCKEDNEHSLSSCDYVVENNLAPNESDEYHDLNDTLITSFLNKTARAMTNAIIIPISQFVEDGYVSGFDGVDCNFSVWKSMDGYSLEERWDDLMWQKEKVMERLHDYVCQLEKVENPCISIFVREYIYLHTATEQLPYPH